jgi:hypothetical protein
MVRYKSPAGAVGCVDPIENCLCLAGVFLGVSDASWMSRRFGVTGAQTIDVTPSSPRVGWSRIASYPRARARRALPLGVWAGHELLLRVLTRTIDAFCVINLVGHSAEGLVIMAPRAYGLW